ncbi:MAG: hypothetical protein V3U75_02825 [Methylococcaceae bacterium]
MLYAIGICQLVQAIDDLDGEFSIGWIGDVFFLNDGINIDGGFLCGFTFQLMIWTPLPPALSNAP